MYSVLLTSFFLVSYDQLMVSALVLPGTVYLYIRMGIAYGLSKNYLRYTLYYMSMTFFLVTFSRAQDNRSRADFIINRQ